MRLQTVLVGLLLHVTKLSSAANITCKHFEEVSEEEYDRTYSSIHETSKRPLGFVRETVPYNSEDAENPCFELENVGNRQVEILYETVPPSVLCLKNLAGTENCYYGRHRECKFSSSNAPTVAFFCDIARGCSESAVNFWVRITIGPPPVEDSEGMWCMNRDPEYPEDLAPLPSAFNPTTTTTPAPSKGSNTNTLRLDLLIAYTVIIYLCYFL